LLKTDTDFNSAIDKIKIHTSNYLRFYLDKIDYQISLGDRSGEALSSINLFNKNTQIYLEILDEAHALENGISTLIDRAVDSQVKSIRSLMVSIKVILMLISISFGVWFYIAVASAGIL
jgi:hypothetical protein